MLLLNSWPHDCSNLHLWTHSHHSQWCSSPPSQDMSSCFFWFWQNFHRMTPTHMHALLVVTATQCISSMTPCLVQTPCHKHLSHQPSNLHPHLSLHLGSQPYNNQQQHNQQQTQPTTVKSKPIKEIRHSWQLCLLMPHVVLL
jgi:hypothetical protein